MDKTTAGACILAVSLMAATLDAQTADRPLATPGQFGPDLVLEGPGSDIGAVVRDLRAADLSGRAPGRGVLIERVEPGSPAARAWLKGGDVVIELDRVSITDVKQFRRVVRHTPPGRAVWVWYFRGGIKRSVVVTPEIVRGS